MKFYEAEFKISDEGNVVIEQPDPSQGENAYILLSADQALLLAKWIVENVKQAG